MRTEIPYYVEFNSKDGHKHYAVHFYNTVTRFVTMLSDLVFSKEA